MKHLLFPVMAVAVMMSCAQQRVAQQKVSERIPIVPRPLKVEIRTGEFVLDPRIQVILEGEDEMLDELGLYFAEYLNRSTGWKIQAVRGPSSKSPRVQFILDKEVSYLGNEGYILDVNPQTIVIRAGGAAGIFYGVQSLRQLLPPEMEKEKPNVTQCTVPCVRIEDKPRFSWRGMHLDVCRHFFPKSFILRYIDLLALHKINVFHWHLTEDQGWRIEIKKYPKLTEIGSWRVDRSDVHWNEREPQKPGEKATYGGFYTQEEVKEVVAYAKKRFITVVPEIEMPGHSVAALAAYPQYSCTGGPFYVMPGGYWPITDIYCAGNDSTFTFLQDILNEVIDLFPSEFIHIGGDEAHKANWEKCPKCQARIRTEGLKDEAELQSYFIKRIEKFINSRGRRMIGWDEILEGGLAPNATVMSWRGVEGGIAAAEAGHDVVMSPTSHCYFDYYQAKDGEPLAIGGFLPLEMVYEFEPVPDALADNMKKYILGAQANLWTEYIPTPEHAEYMLLPRLSALSEVVWTDRQLKSFRDFKNRMGYMYDRLSAMKINFRR